MIEKVKKQGNQTGKHSCDSLRKADRICYIPAVNSDTKAKKAHPSKSIVSDNRHDLSSVGHPAQWSTKTGLGNKYTRNIPWVEVINCQKNLLQGSAIESRKKTTLALKSKRPIVVGGAQNPSSGRPIFASESDICAGH